MKHMAFLLAALALAYAPCAADSPKPTTAPADAKPHASGPDAPAPLPVAAPDPARPTTQQAQAATGPAPTTQPAKSAAARTASRIDFSGTALSTALDFLRDASAADMHVNWRSLEAVGVTKDTPISVKASKITVSHALDLVLTQVNGSKNKMDSVYWVIDEDGLVTVATGAAINTKLRTEVIDVADLLVTVPTFVGPRINMAAANQAGTTGSGASGSQGGQSVFGATTNNQQQESSADAKKRLQESLIKIVKDSIGQDMWEPDGKGSVSFFGTKLVISQTQLGFKLMEMSATAK
jgi:hypothetical protein